jgi:hypothetical protein
LHAALGTLFFNDRDTHVLVELHRTDAQPLRFDLCQHPD